MTDLQCCDEFDSVEELDPDRYTPDELAQLDAYAEDGILDLVTQDMKCGLMDGTTEGWMCSAGQAGDWITCRIIEWADLRLGGAQAIYNEGRDEYGAHIVFPEGTR